MLSAIPRSDGGMVILAATGLACGLAVGPIMSLPSRILPAQYRAKGMGLFFTIYYTCFALSPWLAGLAIEQTGWTGAAFDVGAGLIVLAIVATLLAQLFLTRVRDRTVGT